MGKSLGEKIARKANRPAVADVDIENAELGVFEHREHGEESDGSGDGGSDGDDSDDDDEARRRTEHYVPVGKSKLREEMKKDGLVQGGQYTGVKSSRETLYNESGDSGESESEDGESDEDSESGVSLRTDSEEELGNDSADDDSSAELEEKEDTAVARQKLAQLIQRETQSSVNRLSQTAKKDSLKGHAILQQNIFFDKIIDLRINLQKALHNSNILPLTKQSWKDSQSSKTKKLLKKNQKLMNTLLTQFLDFRTEFQEGVHISQEDAPSKKRKHDSVENQTEYLNKELKDYRDTVLHKWSQKIDSTSGNKVLSSNKFKAINQPANVQVENQLGDIPRLVKRTRLNRRNVVPINFASDWEKGELSLIDATNQPAAQQTQEDEEENLDIPQNYDPRRKDNVSLDTVENPYIFDDEDFYRVLLNDLIDKKLSSNVNSEAAITLKSSTNNKMKKNIDTKASKGRKLNFSIQDPIVSYEAPVNNGYKWSDEQIDEFFNGLLGQKINFNEGDEEGSGTEEKNEQIDESLRNDDIQIFG
ncbi:rRNA-processing protein BFR2 KNAG_0M01600 [Huiozyma naganishii CBS 8797]|uniref:Protein BFR2 n=1 Tax=Huiozyma naganishii (strain ATCC MYA-139 / BCRC 22969 / CBS 8797 / KCTC 17520 / NBRC 10181 / NCYC 3082 / Yp74L-3) TaxID=1071383 RepID=J7RSX3_HUIN7|nr:hypothetical protein KNAG_0M01600 [Kazachstania naganishii CBS 8797]CCK73013.1 hypothetical protein KNAG_0M01600 [Kazachstania naganishii CBS 8797]